MRTDEPSPLTEDERALLEALLSHDFPGVMELREQARHVLAKRGCMSGCGTLSSLEIYSYASGHLPLPPLEQVSWRA